jgi:hypothetical protein
MQPQTQQATVPAKHKTPRKDTRALSEKVRIASEARAMNAPLVVAGIGAGKLQTIQPAHFDRLDVDPRYQRGQTSMVRELVRVIQAGGKILDPVTLCRRPWENGGQQLWIIDGHQRVCAFQELTLPFEAMIHDSESVEAEKAFFLSLNQRRSVSGDTIVKSWTGPSSKMLGAVHDDPAHPLYQRVHFGQGAARTLLGAATIIRGAASAATGIAHSGSIQKQLAKLDFAVTENEERRYLVEQYFRLIGSVYNYSAVNSAVAVRLGVVAFQRWAQHGGQFPSEATIDRLRDIQWREVPSLTSKFYPTMTAMIQKAWKT